MGGRVGISVSVLYDGRMDWNELARLLAEIDPEGSPYEGNEGYFGEYARRLLMAAEVTVR